MAKNDIQLYLRPTALIDSDHPAIQAHAREALGDAADQVEQAARLYLSVRDGIRYDPYSPFHLPEHYQASKVLERRRSFCIPKAALLCALTRASGIPTRIGFADVRNHLATKQLLDYLGSNLFVYHGFVELFLEGKWVKATPAFNRELCERHQVPPIEFTGREDSLFHPYDLENRKYMEYVAYHGTHADIPVAEILAAWRSAYGEERIEGWIGMFNERGTEVRRDFGREEVYRD
jgi:transglutaminase-like putative cysteine protease